ISILFVKRKSVIKKTYKDLPIAIIFLIASEFMFAMNFLTFEVQSFLSNYFRLVAFSIIYLDIILANITTPFNTIFADLKESENKLFESEKKFRSMFEYAPLGYQSLDENGRFVEVNNAWLEMFGYEKKEVIGAWFGDFLCAEYVDTFNANFLKFKNNGETCTYFDMSTKSKERITIAFEGKISYDSNGNFKRTHCILQNITEKQESDRKLAESEDRYHSIYDQAQFGICNIALDGQFINANKKCCDMLGYPLEELQTMYIRDVTYKDDIVVGQEQFATMINNNEVKMIMTNRYVTKNGTIKYLDSLTSIIRDSNQKPLYTMVTIEDVTHIKQLEEDNLKMESHLRNQQKLKSIGTLASGVAHEINNPLNGILNYSQIIYDSVDTDSTIAEQAQEIIHETERISLIVKNLLQFSRHEKHSFTKMNVKDMIEQTLSLIKTIIKRDQINLKIELSENLPNIMCRGQQIQQILMNLLTNARDAVNLRYKEYNDNKIIRLTCKTINKSNMPYVQIMVEDHGYGILESVQDKIFDPFFTTKQRDEGTGLGLSISYGIAKEHSGELSFKTKERTYTRFYLELPIDTDKTVAH
ncbi:MAG: PAS domain S-box protein, partial [Clostridiales bacterium]|nr:PAS domain S-box protein [Clostridiales bacterium]